MTPPHTKACLPPANNQFPRLTIAPMLRIAVITGLLAAAALLFWTFPLFHVVPLEQAEASRAAEAFNAPESAQALWTEKLEPHFDAAADAAEVVAALRRDPQQARREFGRTVGLSRSTLLFVRGHGTVASIDGRLAAIALADGDEEADVALVVGPVTGNAVRDAPGLVASGDFANSQHFNDLARELNLLAERGPVAKLRNSAKVGRTVTFVACGEIAGDEVRWPLKLVPVAVAIE